MPLGTLNRHRPIEFSMLHRPRPTGPTIGTFHGEDIPESIIDEFGRRFHYAGVASRRRNGQFDDDALEPGEFIVQPGLVYRLDE